MPNATGVLQLLVLQPLSLLLPSFSTRTLNGFPERIDDVANETNLDNLDSSSEIEIAIFLISSPSFTVDSAHRTLMRFEYSMTDDGVHSMLELANVTHGNAMKATAHKIVMYRKILFECLFIFTPFY